jgi:gluconate 2-dehydrogenase
LKRIPAVAGVPQIVAAGWSTPEVAIHSHLANIARGGLIDEGALATPPCGVRLATAGPDVFEGQPTVTWRPLAHGNVVPEPHIAGATLSTRRAMVAPAVDNPVAAMGFRPGAGSSPSAIAAKQASR